MRDNPLRARLAAGTPVFGSFAMIDSAFAAEIAGAAGFDWVIVDMEHGPVALDTAAAMVTALRTTAASPIVRVAWNESSQIQRALDLACDGILVPVVNDADDARRAVRDAKFPPLGIRSRGAVRPNVAFATDAMTYFDRANRETLLIVQIETAGAVEQVEAICAVEGVDGVFVGPNDLAASTLQRWPDVWDSDAPYMARVERVGRAARAAGKWAGFLARDAAMACRVIEMGYAFVGLGSDASWLLGAARAAAASMREAAQ